MSSRAQSRGFKEVSTALDQINNNKKTLKQVQS